MPLIILLRFALALNDLMAKEGIDIRYDMLASYPIMEQKICKGLIVESKSGRKPLKRRLLLTLPVMLTFCIVAEFPVQPEGIFSYVAHGCGVNEARKFVETGDALSIRKWILWFQLKWGRASGRPAYIFRYKQ